MDREPTKWIKKDETDEVETELHFIAQDYPCSMNVKEELEESVNKEAQDYPCSMNVKEELEESVNKEFLEDPLKAGDPSVCVKQDPELKHRAAGSEHNSVEDPLGISLSTDFIKEDSELNITENTFLEDPLKAGDPSVCVKQDPELKHRAAGSEHNSVEDPLGIFLSTDFIKEDPELNITENTIYSDYWWELQHIM
ncbi:uncharacterized protein LOC124553865 isoform X10 [Schistocerca americana]|uniref:uncharacterized protein LOC124553865 isoform X10 n=1 Tax=Schistocerca americana TaxID=7009 RepID=UPI001F502F71|nr:uncharacterized protein LOC124553865 isoform X10 [Schistocerca americana]